MASPARRFSPGFALARLCVLLLLMVQVGLSAQTRAAIVGPVSESAGLAAVPVSQMLPRMVLDLKRTAAQQAALEQYLVDVQTPGSGSYRQWMTPATFAQRYAPAATRAAVARQWLVGQGFQVGELSPNGMRIGFSGSALQVNRSFQTALRMAATADESGIAGETRSHLVADSMTVPAELADVVVGVSGVAVQADASATLADAVDANTQAVMLLPQGVDSTSAELLMQAAAQGMTVLSTSDAASIRDAAVLTASAGVVPDSAATPAVRPWWQQAPGLPSDTLRAVPDAINNDAAALVSGLQSLIARRGTRIGDLAPSLYSLRTGHGIFTHADPAVAPGTWTATDGLGTMDTAALLTALNVGTQGSNVSLTPSTYNVAQGSTFTLLFVVTGGSGSATGTVTATLTGRNAGKIIVVGPASLRSDGTQSLTASAPSGDLYDLTGAYSGDGVYAANASNTSTITVAPATATVTATAGTATVGGTIPVTVQVATNATDAPTGLVTVVPSGTSIAGSSFTGTLKAVGTGTSTATVSVPATDAGAFTFQANCTATSSYACNTPGSFAVTVGKGTPGVTLTTTPASTIIGNTSYIIGATVGAPTASGIAASLPTGTVQVMNNGTAIGSVTLVQGSGTTTASLTGTGNSLTGVYSGDANYATATSAAVGVTSAAATGITTVTTITSGVTQTTAGSTVPLTASVTPTNYTAEGAPTGTITYTSSLQGVIGVAVLSNGFVTYNATNLVVGSHVITATFTPATSTYAASTSNPGVAVAVAVSTVKIITSTTLTVSPNTPTIGGVVTLMARITPVATVGAGAATSGPTGTVSFYANDILIATAAVSGGNTGGVTVSATAQLPVATVIYFRATYSGDNTYAGSSSVGFPVTLAPATPSFVLSSSATQTNAGSTIVLTATLGPGLSTSSAVPTGTVAFYDTYNGQVLTLGSAMLLSNGVNASVATFSVTGLQGGIHSISATYNGDGNYLVASSNIVTVNFGDFALAFSPQNLTLSRGGTGTALATLTSSYGFSGAVLLSCTPPATSQITCTFSPSALVTSGQSLLTVTTAGATAKMEYPRVGGRHGIEELGGAAALAGVLGLLVPRRRRMVAGLLMLVVAAVVTGGGCGLGVVDQTQNSNGGTTTPVSGGGGTGSGTPYGTFALTITASSGDTTLRHTYSYQVTVQ